MPLSIGLIGASGRMGQEIRKLVSQHHERYHLSVLFARTTFENQVEEKKRVSDFQSNAWLDPKVLIDFSQPSAFNDICAMAHRLKTPLVTGTTGLSDDQKKTMKNLAKEVPVLWSSNMSPGMALIRKFLSSVSDLSNFELTLSEVHHIWKKDSPSGTAVTLRDLIQSRKGQLRSVQSYRMSDVVGDHEISFFSEGERIRIEHTARDRKVFANGALIAANWIKDQVRNPGLYSMDDVF